MSDSQTSPSANPAEVPAEPSSLGPFTPEKLKQAREAYTALHALFSSPETAAPNAIPEQTAPKGDHKTIGDVASAALDQLGHGVGQIAGIVQEAAPKVWSVMVRQQIASAIAGIIGPIIALIVCYAFHLIIFAAYGTPTDPDLIEWQRGLSTIPEIFVGIICCVWLVVTVMGSIEKIVNPAYFAVRDLVELITGRHQDQS